MAKPLRVLLLGYQGAGNAGDEIVLAGILDGMAAVAGGRPFEVRVLSGNPAETRASHNVPAVPKFSMPAIAGSLLWCNCLVLAGGSLIQDTTSRRSAAYYLGVIQAAQALGKRVFLWAQGFGPLDDPKLRNKAGRLLARASCNTLRDPLSLTELAGLGVPETRLKLTADPAFLIGKALPQPQLDTDAAPVLGVALRPWPSMERVGALLADACRNFLNETSSRALFLPFQLPGDLEISRRGLDILNAPGEVLHTPPRPYEMVNLFRGITLTVGMRLHSLILSAMAGCPFVGLSYDPKVERFCQAAGMPCLTLDALSAGELQDLLLSVYTNRETASRALVQFAAGQRETALQTARLFWQCMED